jgi:hypothetical protein
VRKLSDIAAKLNQMEHGRIYEFTKAQVDEYLATNINQLRKMIADLFLKKQFIKY